MDRRDDFSALRRMGVVATLLCMWIAHCGAAPRVLPVASRQVEGLDAHWRFMRGDAPDASQESFDDQAWSAVDLPHTWNARDGEAGGDYYRGPGWYRRELWIDASPRPVARYLQFDGATLVTDVWVNGHAAGHHEGGFAAFRIDASAALHAGRNVVAVRVDNAPSARVSPLGGDFTVFGGLVRGVSLVTVAPAHLDLMDDGGPGVYVSAAQVAHDRARLVLRARVVDHRHRRGALRLRWTLRDADGKLVCSTSAAVTEALANGQSQALAMAVPRPHLWQGVDDPYLYHARLELLQGGSVIDDVGVPVGIREFRIDPQHGLLLNGKPYALHGVNLFHSERPGQGTAVTDGQVDEDFRILSELGVTGLRLVHFQHPQRAYDDADRLGFVLWTEIPLNSAMDTSDAFRDNLTQQLRELVKQNFNHPAVFIWGLGNEVYRSDAASRELLAELHRSARALDPQRVTSYAHCCAAEDDPMALQTDIAAFNRYFGWYDGQATDIGPWADRVHASQPRRAIGLSEYGAGASVTQQQDPPERPVPASHWHPEQYQALFHEAWWRQLRQRPWLWGTFVWVGFDLPSAGRDEGDRSGVNDKGLVTYDRRTRKEAWFWYQANWSRRPMVHIVGRRAPPRGDAAVDVKVYTNATTVGLQIDGQPAGERQADDHVALWRGLRFAPGVHRLTAQGPGGVADAITWEVGGPSADAVSAGRPGGFGGPPGLRPAQWP